MGYWKSKILPKIKKILNKTASASKKSAAAADDEAINSFSKEQVNEQFEQRKTELKPKLLQIYCALPPEIKALIKEPNEEALKNNSTAILKFLQDLASIEFPGSKAVWEACSNLGPASLTSDSLIFIFDKVSSALTSTAREEAEAAPPTEEISTHQKKELVKLETDIEPTTTNPAHLHPNP